MTDFAGHIRKKLFIRNSSGIYLSECVLFSVEKCSAAFVERAKYEECAQLYNKMLNVVEETERCRFVFYTRSYII